MTNPMNALTKLQAALDQGVVQLRICDIHRDIGVIADRPNGAQRFTYAALGDGKVKAIALFVLVEPMHGVPCLSIGYAVTEELRNKGLATEIVRKGIDELRNGLSRNGIKDFYIEAIVSESNLPSNRLARRLISDAPVSCTDCFSGEAALQYVRKIV